MKSLMTLITILILIQTSATHPTCRKISIIARITEKLDGKKLYWGFGKGRHNYFQLLLFFK